MLTVVIMMYVSSHYASHFKLIHAECQLYLNKTGRKNRELCFTYTGLSGFVHLYIKYPLEKEMATHSSILAWRIPRTEELGGLQSMGRRVGHV